MPLERKEANIIPLFKKGSRNKSVNYRPVSLTSIICKLLETIIRDHNDDIDKLVRWSEKWQMLYNFGKCLHTGPGNTGMNYEMGRTIVSKTVKEKDLRVKMNANMKVSEQCRIAASKGNQVLGMIRRNITYKEKSLIVPLYKAIVDLT